MAENTVQLNLTARDQASGVIRGVMGSLQGMIGQVTMLAGLGGAGLGLGALVKQGIEFNKTMEDSKGGIAGVLLMTREYVNAAGEVVTGQEAMNAAFSEASVIQEKLKKDALGTAASYTELVGAFQTALAPAAAAGVTNLDDVREITVMATQAMAALNIPTAQAAQELRGLFAGDAGPDNRLNQILRVTKAEIAAVAGDTAKAAALFKERLGPAASAAAMQTGTLTVRLSNLGDILDQTMGKATSGMFKEISAGVASLTAGIEEAGASVATTAQAIWVSLKAALGPLEEVGRITFGALDARVKESGGTWTEVIQGFAIVFNNVMTHVRAGWAVVFNAMAHPLDALRLAFGNMLGNLLELMADVAAKLPDFLGGDSIAKSLRSAAAAVDEWGLKENGFLDDLEVSLQRTEEAHKRNEAAILDIGKATQQVTNDPKSNPKNLMDDAAVAAEAMLKAFAKAAKEQGRIYASFVQTSLERSLAFFRTGEAAVEEFISVFDAKLTKNNAILGIKAEWAAILDEIPGAARSAADALRGVWQSASQAFNDLFYSVITGRLESLGDIFRGFADNLAGIFSNLVTGMVQRWIAGQQTIAEGWASLNKSMQNANGGLSVQGGMMAAGTGYGIGGMVGQGTQANQIGAAAGAVIGAIVLSAIPVVGTILGAIVGGLIGELFNKNTEKHLKGSLGGMVGATSWTQEAIYGPRGPVKPGDRDEFGEPEPIGWEWVGTVEKATTAFERAGQKIFEDQAATLSDLFKVGAKDQARTLLASYQAALKDSLSGANFDIAAGSDEDIQRNSEYLLSVLLPRIGLSAAFGQKGYLPTGDRDGKGGIPGINYGMPGMDEAGQWIEKQLYDKDAPIPKMLAGLGFTNEKIAELASRISTDDPARLLAYIQGIVSVVVGLRDLGVEMGKTFEELAAGWSEDAAAGPAAAFKKQVGDLAGMFEDLTLYSGDEQLQKAQEAQAASSQFWESVVSYLRQVQAAMEQMSASLQAQRSAMRDFLNPESEGEQVDRLMGEIDGVWGKLAQAVDPAEVERIVSEAQASIDAIFGIMAERVTRGRALLARLTGLGGALGDISSDVASESLAKSNPLAAWGQDLVDIQRKVLDAARLTGLEQISAIEDVAAAAEELYGNLKDLLSEIASTSASINKSIDSQIWELGVGEMDAPGQASAVTQRIQELQDQLELATSPAEIAAITSEIQSLTNRYVGTFGKDDPNRQAAIDWAKEELERTRGLANEALEAMRKEAEAQAKALQEILKGAVTGISDNVDDATEIIGQLSHTLGELDRVMRDTMTALGQGILDSLEPLRTAMDAAAGIFTGATTTAGNALSAPEVGLEASANRAASALGAFEAAVTRAAGALAGIGGGSPAPAPAARASAPASDYRASAADIIPMVRRYSRQLAPRVG